MASEQGDTDDREPLSTLIGAISPVDALEAEHRSDALDWLRSGAEIYRRVKPATPPKHLIVYAAIVDPAARQCFLISHRKSGLWLPTGGHVDPGEPPLAAARRELREEAGVDLPLIAEHPLFISIGITAGDTVQQHTDVALWYGFAGEAGDRFEVDPEEATGGAWFDVPQLAGLACEPQATRFMRKLAALTP
jgi:8-oxo-dGTP diphosphatase